MMTKIETYKIKPGTVLINTRSKKRRLVIGLKRPYPPVGWEYTRYIVFHSSLSTQLPYIAEYIGTEFIDEPNWEILIE